MSNFLLAIDQGTTGSTVLVIDAGSDKSVKPKVIAKKTIDFPQHFPKAGWVEHDLDEIWDSVKQAGVDALNKAAQASADFSPNKIIAIGITNQRETVGFWDRSSGNSLRKAIVWQCRRSTEICEALKADGLENMVKQKTGLVLDPYFSATKICWVFENESVVLDKMKSGDLCIGTMDAYLLYKLSGGKSFATEASNASRTMLYDINSGSYDRELFEIAKISSADCLPEVKNSADEFGKTSGLDFLPDGIPIAGILGDQQAALAGQCCYAEGEAKCTYGTGAFLLLNTGKTRPISESGVLSTVAWRLGNELTYALEGSAFIAGAAIQFVRDQFNFLTDAAESQSLATQETAAPELYFVPALAGLGAPHWDPRARGAFLGLTRGTSKAQMVRAALEGMAFQVCDLIGAMNQDAPQKLELLRVDGGAAANSLLMQMQADYAGVPVDRPKNLETTAFGAAMFAGLGVGYYESLKDISGLREADQVFEVEKNSSEVERDLAGWQRAVGAVKVFAVT